MSLVQGSSRLSADTQFGLMSRRLNPTALLDSSPRTTRYEREETRDGWLAAISDEPARMSEFLSRRPDC
jgi:hypothetical protein